MAKKNAQEAYQRVREAKAKSRARSGVVISPPPPPPPPKNTGTPTQPIVLSSSSLPRPPPSAQILSEPEKKKRKTSESGSSSFDGGVKADAMAFVRKNIYPFIHMDDVSVRNHLTTMAEESFRTAGVCGKLLDIFEKAPLSSLGATSRVEELEGRLRIFEKHEKELKEERDRLRKERDHLKEEEEGRSGISHDGRHESDEERDALIQLEEEDFELFEGGRKVFESWRLAQSNRFQFSFDREWDIMKIEKGSLLLFMDYALHVRRWRTGVCMEE
ncbi:uncharacterized protein LOC130946044 [Arachis stenosperma]|uniref:uncharacterized protein LOC130946044 n=1 Tax=Arachis stenosperma TaxID=217475 RepID=UPI0025AB80C2|nr:uncharacterized protein LOC130946044 [Arachis stenosperma]